LVQTRTDNAQLLGIGLAPVPFQGHGPGVGFFADSLPVADDFVVCIVVHPIQAASDTEPLIRCGNQWMADADGEAVVLAVRLEFKAIGGGNVGARVAAIAGAIQAQLRAFGIQVLAVIEAVVVLLVIARRKQPAQGQLFGHRRLRVAAGRKQRLGTAAVAFDQAHAGGERFAAGTDMQRRCAIGGARRRHLRLQGHPGNAAEQRAVAVEGFTRQRAFALELVDQFIHKPFYPPDIAVNLVLADIAFDQHHTHQALVEVLLRQERIGQ